MVKQRRIARRVAGADVVDWVDDAGPEKIAPQTVDVALGEIGVVGGSDPSGQLLPARGILRHRMAALEREFWRHRLVGSVVHHLAFGLVAHDFVERLSALDGRATDRAIAALWILGEIHLREVGGGLEVLVLRPAFEGMVVALVAVEPHAQEEVRGVLHRGGRVAQRLEVGRGWVLAVGAGRCEDLSGELVVGRVGGDVGTDPFTQALGTLGTEEFRIHLQQVSPLIRPMLDECIAR